MIEVLFGESEAGTMKAVKENKVNLKREKVRHAFIGEDTNYLIGNPNDVICLPLMLDLGKINDPTDSQYRKDYIYQMYMQSGWEHTSEVQEELKQGIERYEKEQKRLIEFIKQGESIRVWYSNAPYSLCGFYHICSLMKEQKNELSVVKLPEYVKTSKDEVWESIHWGEIGPEQMVLFLSYEKKLSNIEKTVFADKWQELVLENSPLRALISNRLVSVREDFYDFLIDKYLSKEPIKECKLIGDIIGNNPFGVSDYWYAYRIEEKIKEGKIKVLKDSEKKYTRTICLA